MEEAPWRPAVVDGSCASLEGRLLAHPPRFEPGSLDLRARGCAPAVVSRSVPLHGEHGRCLQADRQRGASATRLGDSVRGALDPRVRTTPPVLATGSSK